MLKNDTQTLNDSSDSDLYEYQQSMLTVVRNTKSTSNNLDYKLCKGDVMKLGRIKYKVKFLQSPATSLAGAKRDRQSSFPIDFHHHINSELELDSDFSVCDVHSVRNQSARMQEDSQVDLNKVQCKICWSGDSTIENPLLNSCQCDGSVRYVHYNCLKYWLTQKMERKEVDQPHCKVVSFTWRLFECELCKHAYPYVFKAKGRSYRLIDNVD